MSKCAFKCVQEEGFHYCACVKCGRKTVVRMLPVHADCGSDSPSGLGDRVASALSAVGITKERVAAAIGTQDCGCQQRQQKLNELGYRFGIGTPKPDETGNP